MEDENGKDFSVQLMTRMLRLEDRADSLVAKIALDVGTRIIEGALAPGSDVNSVELSERFGTSRTPVREALLLLEKQGLVEIPARRRPTVVDLSRTPVKDIYDVRSLLSGNIAELVCERRTAKDLAKMKEGLERMRQACESGDVQAYFWANVSYNDTVTSVARNPVLSELIDSLGLRVLQLRRRSMSPPLRMERSLADHDRLFQAYKVRDGDLARALSGAIIRDAYRALSGGMGAHGE
ncbi:GntR family transcriptional regulator [Arthrobacter yangruifuii]|nr:GntR family transcriptional regulator [Arthrobacter yangruifuii]